MSERRLRLDCQPFQQLYKIITEASRSPTSSEHLEQVRYLESYLRCAPAPARSIIVEHPYVDRHWLEEYTGYYATALNPPESQATRLHFHSAAWTNDGFREWLGALAGAALDERERDFNRGYLGFSVIRPLASAPIGRTVLRPYEGESRRCYAPAQIMTTVHLAGMDLRIDGLPFQQQDQGVGACATTAVWSALAKVRRTDGQRAPTPLEVTRWATEHRVQARSFPAVAGLDLDQMAEAIRHAGYQPHVFGTGHEEGVFSLAIRTYLASGIPVVLRVGVEGPSQYHALTLVGYREEPPGGQVMVIHNGSYKLSFLGMTRLYVHDDRFGPYARLAYTLEGEEKQRTLYLRPTELGYDAVCGPMRLHHALVPLYPKLRLTAEELIQFAVKCLPLVSHLAGPGRRDTLRVRPKFWLQGSYLRDALQSIPIEPDRLTTLTTATLLSRYVGVLSFDLGEEWFCDLVLDTTDINREPIRPPAPILAIVCRDRDVVAELEKARSGYLGDRPLFI